MQVQTPSTFPLNSLHLVNTPYHDIFSTYLPTSSTGGLTREWYSVLAREIFNANYALFTSTSDSVTFQPNPQVLNHTHPLHTFDTSFHCIHSNQLHPHSYPPKYLTPPPPIRNSVIPLVVLDQQRASQLLQIRRTCDWQSHLRRSDSRCTLHPVILQAHVGATRIVPRSRSD